MTDRLNVKLWLDDERPAPDGWTWVKTAIEAIESLKEYGRGAYVITHMSFDHDLADVHYDYFHAGRSLPYNHPARSRARELAAREKTGYDVLLWMAEHEVWPTDGCSVHSHNSVGAERMVGVINRYGPYEAKVRWTPYQPTVEDLRSLYIDGLEPNPEEA